MKKNRSLIFVPAEEKMLSKLGAMEADAYIIDLEDSIQISQKEEALNLVIRTLESIDTNKHNIIIRLNSDRYLHEAEKLALFEQIKFMLPKLETPSDYEAGISIWERHGAVGLIETPKGIINVKEIAACPWIEGIAFGAEDYTAKVNMENDFHLLQFQKSMLITYAKAYGKKVYDTPCFKLHDQNLFENEVKNSVALGFDGKLCISPKHIPYINSRFSVVDIDEIKRIVERYDLLGEAVAVIDGNVYEKMHIDRFRRILKECEV